MDMSSASVRGSPWIEVMRQGKGEREMDTPGPSCWPKSR